MNGQTNSLSLIRIDYYMKLRLNFFEKKLFSFQKKIISYLSNEESSIVI